MRSIRTLTAVGLVVGLAVTGATSARTVTAAHGAVSSASSSAEDAPAYTQTKHLTRTLKYEGTDLVVDERDMTVTVDRTDELRGRERIEISWTGARPTGGRASNPFGENGMLQEYPVVVLQCRGVDDAAAPVAQQIRPETCWTSSRVQRSTLVDESQAVWRHDVAASEEARAAKTGLSPIPPECQDVEFFSTHITPFVAANGTVYPACTAETMPPEAAVGSAFPPAELTAYTDTDGNGSVQFEVRSAIENESLGCSDKVDCAVVVIPIMGISCMDDDVECNKAGQFEPGSSNYGNVGVDLSVSPQLWWSESNWRHRFTVPLDFGLPPDACDVLDDRPPTGFYGSELMAQASLQWAPAYCLDKKRFKFQHNKMADEAAFALMDGGGAAAAFVSGEHESRGADAVAYAPTAVTGFSIAYIVDRPDNAGEFTGLRLNARLLAKLLTQSYLGSDRGRSHPGIESNPLSLNLDPEFQQLNPGLDLQAREAGAVLLSLSEASDVLTSLTSYVAGDKDAAAFIAGKTDQWGMRINPAYKGIKLPRDEWPLLDDYVPPTNDECYAQNPAPYFTQLAAPISSLRKIAEAVLDSWPNVQTKCERPTVNDPWKIGRIDRQGVGSRFMLGVVSVGDARRFGLHEAALATSGGKFVAPTDAAMSQAVSLATPSKSGTEPFDLPMERLVKAGSAYPGTMIVYTAARTSGMLEEDAQHVGDFIRVATSEGQQAGHGNGELPEGYLPLRRTGATAPLLKQAQSVAEAVAKQTGEPAGADDTAGPDGESTPSADATIGAPGSVSVVDAPPAVGAPVDGPGTTPGTTKVKPGKTPDPGPVTMPPTELVSSAVAGRLLPVVLSVALLGLLLTGLLRIALWRRRPSA